MKSQTEKINIHILFHELFEPELISEMETYGTQQFISEEETVLEPGEIIRTVPIVLSGVLKVTRPESQGQELLLYYVNPKGSCAVTFTCCMQQYPSEIRISAEEDSMVLFVPINLLDDWMKRFSTWKSFVMRTMREQFNELFRSIDQIAFQKLDDRLIAYLKEKSKVTGSTLINLSHQEIADELASSRVVISRLLKKLENEKRLILYRNQIKLLHQL